MNLLPVYCLEKINKQILSYFIQYESQALPFNLPHFSRDLEIYLTA